MVKSHIEYSKLNEVINVYRYKFIVLRFYDKRKTATAIGNLLVKYCNGPFSCVQNLVKTKFIFFIKYFFLVFSGLKLHKWKHCPAISPS